MVNDDSSSEIRSVTSEIRSVISESGSRISKWLQVYIEIKLFGVTIFKKSIPPDDDSLSKCITPDSVNPLNS